MTISEHEIEQRAQSNARGQARRELQAEQQARDAARSQAIAENARQGQAMLAQLAQRWRAELAPLYARRADAHRRGDLDDAYECEKLMKAIHDEAGTTVDMAARLLQQQPADVVAQLRRDAGVPAHHDSLSEAPDLSDIRRVVARGMAIGLIGSNGVGHPNMKGLIQL